MIGETPASSSSSSVATVTGKGRIMFFYGGTSSVALNFNIDGLGYKTIYILNGMGVELYFNQSVSFYSAKSMYYVVQVE